MMMDIYLVRPATEQLFYAGAFEPKKVFVRAKTEEECHQLVIDWATRSYENDPVFSFNKNVPAAAVIYALNKNNLIIEKLENSKFTLSGISEILEVHE